MAFRRIILSRVLLVTNLVPKALYARGVYPKQLKYGNENDEDEDILSDGAVQHIGDMMSALNLDDPRVKEELMRMDRKERTHIKKKIIERKYFKPEAEINLLTWAAKEQIRFLSQEHSEEWNPDRISESFPISKEGVILLLKSSFSPRTQEELLRHDKRVKKSWLALKSKTGVEGGPVYQQLQSQRILPLMENADGIASLPKPETKRLPSLGLISPGVTGGVFESIVKDYVDLKKQSDCVNIGDNRSDENARLLKSITDSSEPYNYKNTDKHQRHIASGISSRVIKGSGTKWSAHHSSNNPSSMSKMKHSKLDNESYHGDWNARDLKPKSDSEKSCSHEDVIMLNKNHMPRSKDVTIEWDQESIVDRHWKDLEQNNVNNIKLSRKERRLKIVRNENQKSEVNTPEIEAVQMKGTEKVGVTMAIGKDESEKWRRAHHDKERSVNVAYSSKQTQNAAFGRQSHDRDVFNKMKVDHHRSVKTSGVKDVYMYDSSRGYQNPLGKYDASLENIDMHKGKRSAGDGYTYRKGDTVYDDDGEFLYRIP